MAGPSRSPRNCCHASSLSQMSMILKPSSVGPATCRISPAGDGGAVLFGGPLQRRLLAALVLGAGEARSRDALIDALWGEKPPASASKLLQVYVSQLRRALPAPAHIETRNSGYALKVEAD